MNIHKFIMRNTKYGMLTKFFYLFFHYISGIIPNIISSYKTSQLISYLIGVQIVF